MISITVCPTLAQDEAAQSLWQLITEGQTDAAIADLIRLAQQRGGFGPAPGDSVIFAPNLIDTKQASTVAIDAPPTDCNLERDKNDPPNPACGRDFQIGQNLVQFGPTTFAEPLGNGDFIPRPLDDILSIYIEEVGHSWQEYCYETEGCCAGERTRLTTWGEGMRLASGWEYQVKMYILSLDGNVLHLSVAERNELLEHICDGYANPRFSEVLPYAAPPGWPNPNGWPLVNPTREEFQHFCESTSYPPIAS